MMETWPSLHGLCEIKDFHLNPNVNFNWSNHVLPDALLREAQQTIKSWQGYAPSPAVSLSEAASAAKLGQITYKDESGRFGLGSFKALGGAFAVTKCLSEQLGVDMAEIIAGRHVQAVSALTVATATDGNHGRSVAWGAKQAGCNCRIYIHANVSEGRAEAMRAFGAEVIRIEGDYDQSVRLCAQEAKENGWFVISDTSYEGYEEVPRWVMAGYGLMGAELVEQIETSNKARPITHVIGQAGVGGMATGLISGLHEALKRSDPTVALPRLIILETEHAPCLIESIRQGGDVAVPVKEESMMAGLSCGEPSKLTLQCLRHWGYAFVTMSDRGVATTMRLMAKGNQPAIEAGECAAGAVLATLALAQDEAYREALGLDENAHVLVIGTEGATDPDIYQRVMQGRGL